MVLRSFAENLLTYAIGRRVEYADMRLRNALIAAIVAAFAVGGVAQKKQRLNPVIDLLEQGKPVFGVYWPTNPMGRRGAPPPPDAPKKTAAELAKEALAYPDADFLFSGGMEGGVDRGLPAFIDFANATKEAGALQKSPFARLPHPLVVKTSKISEATPEQTISNISRQLNVGASGIMFVEAESADEVRRGISAMRFKSNGGSRPDDVGAAPGYWGMDEAQYKKKADLWPLNPDGELINWTIVESKEGLAHLREIAAVKGIGVLWPGAGTLRGVFSTTNEKGERVTDMPRSGVGAKDAKTARNCGDISTRRCWWFFGVVTLRRTRPLRTWI